MKSAKGVFVSDNYVYLAAGNLKIINISNPSNPTEVSSCDLGSYNATEVYVLDHFAYVANEISGLAIVSVYDPNHPYLVATYDTPGEGNDISVVDEHIFLADRNSLSIFEFQSTGACNYFVGDYNGNRAFNIADIISAFSKLKTGSPDASLLCECPPGSGDIWAVAMDLNNSCSFNVADVIVGFSKLKTGEPELVPCELCPPGGR